MFAVPPARLGEVFVLVLGWRSRYDSKQIFYVPSPPVFSYCTDSYTNLRDDKRRVAMITRTENALMTMARFLQLAELVIRHIRFVILNLTIIATSFSFRFRPAF